MVPQTSEDDPVETEGDAAPESAPRWGAATRANADVPDNPYAAPTPRPSRPIGQDPDWDGSSAKGASGPVISFDAIGMAWNHFESRTGTWVLAVLAMYVTLVGCNLLLVLLWAFVGLPLEQSVVGTEGMLTFLGMLVAAILVQAVVFWGGLFKLALKQIDGGEIQVADAFFAGRTALGLAVAGPLILLGFYLGLLMFIVPGIIVSGLFMFAVPGAVDGLGPIEAIIRSIGTLKRQWVMASLFLVVTVLIGAVGGLFCGIGALFTMPVFVLSIAVQYRRSFAPGGVPRYAPVADPWANAVGETPRATGSARVPVWVWGILSLMLLTPVVLIGGCTALLIPAVREAQMKAREQEKRHKQAEALPDDADQNDQDPGAMPPPVAREKPEPEN